MNRDFFIVCSFLILSVNIFTEDLLHAQNTDILNNLDSKLEKHINQDSLLEKFTDNLANKVKNRLQKEALNSDLNLKFSHDRNISPARLKMFVMPQITHDFKENGMILSSKSQTQLHLEFSIRGSQLWCVATLKHPKMAAPINIVVLSALDREFETSIAKSSKHEQSSFWQLKRLRTLPAGVLDLVMIDMGQELGDEVVVLSVDGIRRFRYQNAAKSLQKYGSTIPLPEPKIPWPRQILGRLAALDRQTLALSTSANQYFIFKLRSRSFHKMTPTLKVVSASKQSRQHTFFLQGEYASPLLSLSMHTFKDTEISYLKKGIKQIFVQKNQQQNTPYWPLLLRDVAQFHDRSYFLDQNGFLFRAEFQKKPKLLQRQQFGDRIYVLDLNQDGQEEVALSSASPLGQNDMLLLLASEQHKSRILFRSALSGGSISAFAAGDLNGDGLPELLIVEEHLRAPSTLWILEYRQ